MKLAALASKENYETQNGSRHGYLEGMDHDENPCSLESQSSPPGANYIFYYLKTPPVLPTASDKRIVSELEAFCRQIAELKNLVQVHIDRMYFNERGSIDDGHFKSEKRSCLGLRLRGIDVDRSGFLDLLRGLRKPKKVGGSTVWETKDFKF
ncbi:MAG: hypothetical protein JOS17DRAFT_787020 [Linnemannia elongata]|nr:MAG: hypothetical protein JOS17DRAFT_787020 [Linnemannia elongata]